jgi:hypothetical protein
MKVSVIQSKQKVLYDVNNPGDFSLETCKILHNNNSGKANLH